MRLLEQVVFDRVYSGLEAQGFRRSMVFDATAGGRICRYRGDAGFRCAAGMVIPDDCYDPRMEGKDIEAVIALWPALPAWLADHVELLDGLQMAHDAHPTPAGMERALRKLAARRGLTVPS